MKNKTALLRFVRGVSQLALCFLAFVFPANPALAHEKYRVDTVLQPDPTGVRVQHRLVWHDVAGAIQQLDGGEALESASVENIARIRNHVEARFRLFVVDGELPLQWLGAQKLGDVLLVQQRLNGQLSGKVQVWHALLGEVFPLQVNRLYCKGCSDEMLDVSFFSANNLFLQNLNF